MGPGSICCTSINSKKRFILVRTAVNIPVTWYDKSKHPKDKWTFRETFQARPMQTVAKFTNVAIPNKEEEEREVRTKKRDTRRLVGGSHGTVSMGGRVRWGPNVEAPRLINYCCCCRCCRCCCCCCCTTTSADDAAVLLLLYPISGTW